MSGLYAVVFDQGTVKVGQSDFDQIYRIREHRRYGHRFGIKVWHEIKIPIPKDKLWQEEDRLINSCCTYADRTNKEWFQFSSKEHAVSCLKIFEESFKIDAPLPRGVGGFKCIELVTGEFGNNDLIVYGKSR